MKKCMAQVAKKILELWDHATLPTRSQHHVFEDVRKLWERKENVGKSRKGKPASYARAAAPILLRLREQNRRGGGSV